VESVGYVTEQQKALYGDEKLYGGCNDSLPNMKEITEADFAQSIFFTYHPIFIGYKQIMPDRLVAAGLQPELNTAKQPCMMAIHYFVFHNGTGIAMSRDYWSKKVRYFSFFLCKHTLRAPTEEEMRPVAQGGKGYPRPAMCFHVGVCTKCGYVEAVDSSD
jgi:hypothetical protein